MDTTSSITPIKPELIKFVNSNWAATIKAFPAGTGPGLDFSAGCRTIAQSAVVGAGNLLHAHYIPMSEV